MANFIEINQGIFVKADSIQAVVDTDYDEAYPEIVCRVYTAQETFPSVLPSSIILEIIGVKEEAPAAESNETQEQMLNIMKTQSTFAG